jgi:hypothetical protein
MSLRRLPKRSLPRGTFGCVDTDHHQIPVDIYYATQRSPSHIIFMLGNHYISIWKHSLLAGPELHAKRFLEGHQIPLWESSGLTPLSLLYRPNKEIKAKGLVVLGWCFIVFRYMTPICSCNVDSWYPVQKRFYRFNCFFLFTSS